MRTFAKPVGIDRLSLEARVLYTAFSLFLLIGSGTSVWFYVDDQLGVTPADAAGYYLGDDATVKKAASARPSRSEGPALELPEGGPAIALPDDATAAVRAGEMRFEKPPRQVMETFHFHLFSVPVCLLIVGHLFMMCSFSTRTKAWLLALTSVATLAHLLAPPLIRFVSASFAALVFPSALAMALLWTFLLAWPIVEMWRAPRRRGQPSA